MTAGRPSLFTPELIAKAVAYADGGWKADGRVIPTIEGLAVVLGVAKKTIFEWEKTKESEEFSNAVESVRQQQGALLIHGGIKGEFNSTITKLLLSSNHGYRERTDVTSDDKPIQTGVNVPLTPEAQKAIDDYNEAMRKAMTS